MAPPGRAVATLAGKLEGRRPSPLGRNSTWLRPELAPYLSERLFSKILSEAANVKPLTAQPYDHADCV